jgi:S1-C subfamily serine protease
MAAINRKPLGFVMLIAMFALGGFDARTSTATVTSATASTLELKPEPSAAFSIMLGALTQNVSREGATNGLQRGDVILRINGQQVSSVDQLVNQIQSGGAQLSILRSNSEELVEHTITIQGSKLGAVIRMGGVVADVFDDSSGLEIGDFVTRIGGREFNSGKSLLALLDSLDEGQRRQVDAISFRTGEPSSRPRTVKVGYQGKGRCPDWDCCSVTYFRTCEGTSGCALYGTRWVGSGVIYQTCTPVCQCCTVYQV